MIVQILIGWTVLSIPVGLLAGRFIAFGTGSDLENTQEPILIPAQETSSG